MTKMLIEPGVQDLVSRMNLVPGVQTIASCHGHVLLGKPPYVYFKAPTTFASAMENRLRSDGMSGKPQLRTLWLVEGHFNEQFDLVFTLLAPEYRRHNLLGFLATTRNKLDADLRVLSRLVEQVMDVWKSNFNQVEAAHDHDDQANQSAHPSGVSGASRRVRLAALGATRSP